ncbi:MAG: hypothetical protein GYA24_19870 [Candidatus Lokiarchaeota archaeon]|nr:hypothetical protein [Candidatus Lokiarchaeota archaeon]
MATKPARLSFKDVDIKILLQKIVGILVIQFGIYWIFTIVDPGFTRSLVMYFWLVAIGSMVLVAWVHVHNAMDEARKKNTRLVDQPDYAGN